MTFTLTRGSAPLLISFPHSGTYVPSDIADRFTSDARSLPDTDWHVPQLYDFAHALGAWTLEAHASRYVIDLNRDPADVNLYPGQSTTSLCPLDTFAGRPVYRDGAAPPDAAEIAARTRDYWQPYHRALAGALDTMRNRYGEVILYDAHSIRSVVPRFFDGRLTDLNLGTARGQSCGGALRDAVAATLRAGAWSVAIDGRFVGGHITRHYGRPDRGVHALQMEIAQTIYMHESGDLTLRPIDARALSALLQRVCSAALAHLRV